MKNIQVIDSAENCTFSIFQATDEEFAVLFPGPEQDIQFAVYLDASHSRDAAACALANIWERPVRKRDAQGIHGTLFYGLLRFKELYRENREDGIDPSAVNSAQRRLFGIS